MNKTVDQVRAGGNTRPKAIKAAGPLPQWESYFGIPRSSPESVGRLRLESESSRLGLSGRFCWRKSTHHVTDTVDVLC